jgi:hypothetical protein
MANIDRFKDLDWVHKASHNRVLIAGVGGIGSWLALALARSNFNITLRDYDTIEAHNSGGQLYSHKEAGMLKIHALRDTVKYFCDSQVSHMSSKIEESSDVSKFNYYASCFDNMEARKILFNKYVEEYHKKLENEVRYELNWGNKLEDVDITSLRKNFTLIGVEETSILDKIKKLEEIATELSILKECKYNNHYNATLPKFIDGRLGVENYEIYFVDSHETMLKYQQELFDDNEVEDLPCTAKQTSYMAMMISSMMTNTIINSLSDIREVPFKTSYLANLMMFEYE